MASGQPEVADSSPLWAILEEANYLVPVQTGFRLGHRIEMILVVLLMTEGVLFDLSIAFDLIDHSIPLDHWTILEII